LVVVRGQEAGVMSMASSSMSFSSAARTSRKGCTVALAQPVCRGFGHALGHDLVNRAFNERGRGRFPPSPASRTVHQCAVAPLEVTKKAADVWLDAIDSGRPRPCACASSSAIGLRVCDITPSGACVRSALRTVQVTNRLAGKVRVGGAFAELRPATRAQTLWRRATLCGRPLGFKSFEQNSEGESIAIKYPASLTRHNDRFENGFVRAWP
jgi:hypothetical protein